MTIHYYICLGDRTSGGGVVVEGNLSTSIMGRPVASKGMKAICCARPQTIMQGYDYHLDQNKSVAYHGCLLSCGHQVIASQNIMGWSDGNDSSIPEKIMSKPQKYHEFFTVKDDSGNPLEGQKYRLTSDDGSMIEGYTNAKGQTQHLWTHEEHPVNLEFLQDEEDVINDDIYHITDVDQE